MAWQEAVEVVAALAVSVVLAVLLSKWLRSRDYEVRRLPLRASLRPRWIACLPVAFVVAIGSRIAISPPAWWLVPLGVLAGIGGLSTLTFAVFGLLFDAEHARRRPPNLEKPVQPTGSQ